jgi:hypothetical protein
MILYKYLTAERLIGLLETQKIRLTQYFDQNDPYEGSFALMPIDREKDLAIKDDYSAERAELEVHLRHTYFQFGMICLAENFNNILMWSHYADNHRGAVVGFDVSHPFFNTTEKLYDFEYGGTERDLGTPGFGSPKKIDYVERRIYISLGENYSLYDIFFTKSIHWSYEKESRIIKNIYNISPDRILQSGEKIYLTEVPKECITNIIFGLRCGDDVMRSANDLVYRTFPKDVGLSRAKLAHLTFDIEISKQVHTQNNYRI